MTDEVLGLQLSATECLTAGAATPVPESWTPTELVALLAIVRLPVSDPAAEGPNVTLTVADCFGVRVIFEAPVAVKPVPEAVTFEIFKSALPVLVRTTDWEDDVPTVTLPKLTVEVLAEICGAEATPVPDSPMEKFDPLLLKEIEPEAEPAADGWNEAVKFALWPAPRVIGVGIPEPVNPVPETAKAVIVTSALPVFVSVIV